jgi:hypothetical protein
MSDEATDTDCPWVYKDMETALRGLLSAGPAVKGMQISGESRVRDAVAVRFSGLPRTCHASVWLPSLNPR